MVEVTKMIITLLKEKNYMDVMSEFEDGTVTKKKVSAKELAYSLSAATTNEYIHIGRMPKGYYDSRIDATGKDCFDIVLTTDAGIYPVQYLNEPPKLIPFPKLAFRFSFMNGQLKDSLCFALKTGSPVLYHYPFGNVYSNGKICWGGHSFDGITKLHHSEQVARKFYELATNDDLWSSTYVHGHAPILSAVYNELAGMETFPEEWLFPASGEGTIDELLLKK